MRTYTLTGSPAGSQLLPYPPAPYLYYRGFSIRETGSSTASLVIYDGTSAAGNILDTITLISNESTREDYGLARIARTGIYVAIVAGSIAGSIFLD